MNSSPIPVVYVFHGPDEPTLRESLAELCSRVTSPGTADLNTTRLEGQTVELGEIKTAANTLPFLADTRLVLVDNLTESSTAKTLLEGLAAVISGLPDSTRLVFVEAGLADHSQDSDAARRRKTARQSLLKKLVNIVENDPRGKVYEFKKPQDTARWLIKRAAMHSVQIEPSAAQLLAERIGDDLTLADTELAKLATYVNGERPIRVADVELLTPFTPEANIFHMVDALGQRNGQHALTLLRQLLDAGDEPLRIFAMIVRQYRLLLLMREYLDTGGSLNNAAQALDLSEFVAKKVAGQAKNYRLEQLERIYRYLLETDISMKGGMPEHDLFGKPVDRLDPALALEELVARLGSR